MIRSLLAVVAVMICSCGQDECAQAHATLQSCGIPQSAQPTTCQGRDLQYLQCVNAHTTAVCAGLANTSDASNAFNLCISALSGA